MDAVTLLAGFVFVVLLLYKYSTRNFNYWKDRDILHPKPLPFVGNIGEVFAFRFTFGHYLGKLYDDFKTPFVGIYVLNKPCLVVRDRELMKSMLITDFNNFCDRNLLSDERCDPIMANAMGMIKNPRWKSLRGKMSPLFSIAKLKGMMSLINEVIEEMITFIHSNLDQNYFEVKEMCDRFTIDVTATCMFGFKAHCFTSEDVSLLKIARLMFEFNWKNGFTQTCYFMAPTLAKLFRLPFFDPRVNEFLRKVFWTTLEERRKSNLKRNDLVDVINQLRNENKAEDEYQFEGDRVLAQPLNFFSAGFETTSSTLSFVLYELCINKNVQDKLREEIRNFLADDKVVTYEKLQEMKYLEMVVYETLRKYPPLPFLDRICTKDYKIPNTDIVIEKGTPVFVPMYGFHRDPQIYPNPDKFQPERFEDKNKENLSFLPFGLGPRQCIGAKLGMIEVKTALTRILSEFEVDRCSKTPVPIQFETRSFLIACKGGLPMKFTKLTK